MRGVEKSQYVFKCVLSSLKSRKMHKNFFSLSPVDGIIRGTLLFIRISASIKGQTDAADLFIYEMSDVVSLDGFCCFFRLGLG